MSDHQNAQIKRLHPFHIALRLFLTLVGLVLAAVAMYLTFTMASPLPLPLFAAALTLSALSVTRRPGHTFAVAILPVGGALALLVWPNGGPASWIVFASTILVARVIDLAASGHRFVWQ